MFTAYIVATRRRDGSMPKLCKACNEQIFFSRDKAENLQLDLDREYGKPIFGIFEIAADIIDAKQKRETSLFDIGCPDEAYIVVPSNVTNPRLENAIDGKIYFTESDARGQDGKIVCVMVNVICECE